jgi:serine/threonine-protein kinase
MGSANRGDSSGGLARDIEAWLETLAADTSLTLRTEPRATVIPNVIQSTGGRRAMAMLEQLSRLSPAASAQLKPGATIGEGGMGIIRLAEQTALGRMVAVKTLKDPRADANAALDLLREAWVTGSLEHPNIVPVHHVELDDAGRPVIVLKRIEGVSWHDVLEDAPLVAEHFGAHDLLAWNLGILLQVLNAVRFAHSRGIIHRDLKPANVMVGEFGEVYLLDWGIAVSLRDDGSGRLPLASDAAEMAGTPCYMAPEMLGREGAPPLSERTDVYLAGAVLYEVITGQPPHQGTTAVQVVTSVIASRPMLPDDAPPELARICLQAMAADPAARFASIDEMRAAIASYLEHRGSARLAELARARKDELLALLALPVGAPGREREEIYRLYGACKFGFHEALSAWRDNVDAHAGLVEATIAVAEYELAGDDPRAAVGLLSELEHPPPELLARVRAAADAHAARRAELEVMQRELDSKIGTRTRMFITGLLGVIFTVAPLVGGLYPGLLRLEHHVDHVFWSLGLMAFFAVLGYWARDSMRKTLINRRLFATGLHLFTVQITLWLGAWYLDVPVPIAQVLMIFSWFAISGMVTIGIDRRMAPTTVAFLIAFLVAARYPTRALFVMSAANLSFTVNAIWAWRPDTLRWTDEERRAVMEERERRRRSAA